MRSRSNLYRSERGAIFIQVGMVILALMAINVFVVDYGVMWTARGQAQTAADAAALAGATARAYDARIIGNPGVTQAAQQVANLNQIWTAAGTSTVLLDNCPAGVTNCVRVNVSRTLSVSGGNLFFAPMLGITSYDVEATATAMVGPANTTTCMKPWALPDEWREFGLGLELPELDFTTAFHAWLPGGLTLDASADTYIAPNSIQATTATNFSTDYGDIVQFKLDYALMTADIVRGLMLPLALPGSKTHTQNMLACNGEPIHIGQTLSIDATLLNATAEAAAQANFALDGAADWRFEGGLGNGYVVSSCAPNCAPISPRTWVVPLYDPSEFERQRRLTPPWSGCPGGTPCITVTNITGFFIDHLDTTAPNGRHGHFVRYPGIFDSTQPVVVENGSWLVQPRLIR